MTFSQCVADDNVFAPIFSQNRLPVPVQEQHASRFHGLCKISKTQSPEENPLAAADWGANDSRLKQAHGFDSARNVREEKATLSRKEISGL